MGKTGMLVALGLCATAGAASAAPKWLDCGGTFAIHQTIGGKPQESTLPIRNYYIYDDDSKSLYQYIVEMKGQVAASPVSTYTPQKIEWAVPQTTDKKAIYWNAELDRTTMALKMVINDPNTGEVSTFDEKCKPTEALADVKLEPPKPPAAPAEPAKPAAKPAGK